MISNRCKKTGSFSQKGTKMLNFSLFLVIIGCREIEIFSAARNKASLRVPAASSALNRLDAEATVRTPATRDINAGDPKATVGLLVGDIIRECGPDWRGIHAKRLPISSATPVSTWYPRVGPYSPMCDEVACWPRPSHQYCPRDCGVL